MRATPSLHSNFFSSLKQVEKRLKSEQQSQPLPVQTTNSFIESLSSPLHIHFNHSNNNEQKLSTFSDTESSEPPQAFLSCSPQFPPTPQIPIISEPTSVDDIEELIQLLGLCEGGLSDRSGLAFGCGSCHCEGGFYSNIVGVKGPKCGKEIERLEGWIDYFMNGDGNEKKIEPLRLSLLLLGKAAFVSQGENSGFGGLDFPSAIDEFLMNDPPTTKTA